MFKPKGFDPEDITGQKKSQFYLGTKETIGARLPKKAASILSDVLRKAHTEGKAVRVDEKYNGLNKKDTRDVLLDTAALYTNWALDESTPAADLMREAASPQEILDDMENHTGPSTWAAEWMMSLLFSYIAMGCTMNRIIDEHKAKLATLQSGTLNTVLEAIKDYKASGLSPEEQVERLHKLLTSVIESNTRIANKEETDEDA